MKYFKIFIIIIVCFLNHTVHANDKQLLEKIQILEQKVQRLEEIIAKTTIKEQFIERKPEVHAVIKKDVDDNTKFIGPLQTDLTENKPTIQPEIRKDTADNVKLYIKPFPKIESEDKKYSIALNAFIQNDLAFFNHYTGNVKEGATVRNARISIGGNLGEGWSYFLQTNLANTHSNPTYALISYHFTKDFTLSIGKMCEVFGLENSQQTRDQLFLEKSLISNITPSNKTGVMAIANGDNWFGTLGGFGNYSDHVQSRVHKNNYSVTTRMAYIPINYDKKVVHLGINGGYQKSHEVRKVHYRAKAESELSPHLIDTGSINNVKYVQSYGLEFAAARGPIMIQSEYVTNILSRNKGSNAEFKGGYVELAWVLTGESRDYNIKRGIFKGITPLIPFSINSGGRGAWELAIRYNYLTLNSKKANVFGGSMRNTTFGMNWYPNEYVKIMTNYSLINADRYSVLPKNKSKILMLRAQIGF